MKTVDLGQIVTILANLGVIAGIVFLAYEVRQNNELLGIEQRASSFDRQVSTVDVVLNNSETDLLDLLAESVDDMSPKNRNTLMLLGVRMFIVYEQAFQDVQAGLIEEDDAIRALRAVYQRPVLNYGLPLAWETYRKRARPDFVEWMEENIIAGE
jgi:hypothetical protein